MFLRIKLDEKFPSGNILQSGLFQYRWKINIAGLYINLFNLLILINFCFYVLIIKLVYQVFTQGEMIIAIIISR